MSCFSVAEKFVSINGEGVKAGELAVFLRFCGCNLNCSFCDTRWANAADLQGEQLTTAQLVDYVKSTGVKNVTLTGGEPLLQANISELIDELIRYGFEVEIETNGSIPLKDFSSLPNRPSFTMDYKLAGSGMEMFMCVDNFAYLSSDDTIKFVVGDIADLNRAAEIICTYDLTAHCHVYFSPVFGRIKPDTIVDFMKANKLNDVRLQLQLHKYIWDPNERGV
ncbi:MAG: putative 7-carboxy-7-deazaguanine synthase QueE [Clostridiales bacterium]|nr:putative 7-carboxy-7-deazaguanine synthase QueE [Clostridiales bacterium]